MWPYPTMPVPPFELVKSWDIHPENQEPTFLHSKLRVGNCNNFGCSGSLHSLLSVCIVGLLSPSQEALSVLMLLVCSVLSAEPEGFREALHVLLALQMKSESNTVC